MDLNQVTVPITDLGRSILFYETLGLKLIVHSEPNYARFECPNGNSTFSLHKVEKLCEGQGIYVYFECKAIDEQVETLLQKGIVFDEQANDKPWLWREARLKDPDGNQLILFYGGENRINPPWKLKDS